MTATITTVSQEYLASVLGIVARGEKLNKDSIVALGDMHFTNGTKVDAEKVGAAMDALSQGAVGAIFAGTSENTLESLYALARSHAVNGQLSESRKLLKYLCTIDHLNKRNWVALGKVQLLQKKYPDALNSFSFGAVLDIDDPTFPLNCAQTLFRMNDLDKALSGVEHAERLNSAQSQSKSVESTAKEISVLKAAILRRLGRQE